MTTKVYYASLKQRLLANLIDVGVIFGFTAVLFLVLLSLSDNYKAVQVNAAQYGYVLGLYLYMPVLDFYGGTFGKRAMKIVPYSAKRAGLAPSLWACYKKYLFYATPLLISSALHVLISLTIFMFGSESTISDFRNGYIEPSPSTLGQTGAYAMFALYLIVPFTIMWSSKRQAWHDRFAGIMLKSNVPNEPPKSEIAGIEIPNHITRQHRLFTRPHVNIPNEAFTSKIAYLIYLLVFILIIMFTKYFLDIKRDERHFELKRQYEADGESSSIMQPEPEESE